MRLAAHPRQMREDKNPAIFKAHIHKASTASCSLVGDGADNVCWTVAGLDTTVVPVGGIRRGLR